TLINRYVLLLGGDLAQWRTDGLDRWHIGAMAGYANSQTRTQSSVSDYHSRGPVPGYRVGRYGTWSAHPIARSGGSGDPWRL
ncbi:autotransporter outer membrane beta-barrel domain-containing protein, partial [Salmonella enterica subsp. enterica serovar Infantis]